MPLPEYSRLDRASPPPPMPRPSSTLEKLISERIPLKDVLDGALDGSNTLNDEIHEAETARARLHSFIDSCREEKNPCLKTVQEIGYYNTELREWTTQLAKLEIEMLALQTDIAYLNHALHTAFRRPTSTSPFISMAPQQAPYHRDPHTLPTRPATTTNPYANPYASPYATPQAPPSTHEPAPAPDMSSWAKGLDQYSRCTRTRREGRYHIILLAPNDNPERGLRGNRWTPAMGFESMRREAEEARKGW